MPTSCPPGDVKQAAGQTGSGLRCKFANHWHYMGCQAMKPGEMAQKVSIFGAQGVEESAKLEMWGQARQENQECPRGSEKSVLQKT